MKNRIRLIVLSAFIALAATAVLPRVPGAYQGGVAFAASSGAPIYLALGDALSVGAGVGADTGHRTCGGLAVDERLADRTTPGYVCPLWADLRASYPSIQLVNLGLATSPAEDSCSFASAVPCGCTGCSLNAVDDKPLRENLMSGDSLPYSPYRESQLDAALMFLAEHPDQVQVISLDVGSADLQSIIRTVWGGKTARAGSQINAALDRLTWNYRSITAQLRAAAPHARIILMDAVNPLSGAAGDVPAGTRRVVANAYASFADMVRVQAQNIGAVYGPVGKAFQDRATSLTWVAYGSPNPNRAGYTLYARTAWHSYLAATSRPQASGRWTSSAVSDASTVERLDTPRALVAADSTARGAVASATIGNTIYTVGGLSGASSVLRANETFNTGTGTWASRAPMPAARAYLATVAARDAAGHSEIYALGGYVGNETATDANEAYNPATNRWTTRASMPTARWGMAFTLGPNGLIYTFGGNHHGSITGSRLVEVYNPRTNTWNCSAGDPSGRCASRSIAPLPRLLFAPAAVTAGGAIYVIGGYDGHTADVTGTVYVYSPTANRWTQKAALRVPRLGLGAAMVGGKIYAIGGGGRGTTADTEVYNPSTNRWTAAASMPTARSHFGTAVVNRRIYALDGFDNGLGVLNVTEAFTP